ncbi:hypothetical protein RQM65_17325 [Pricia sp. S334]|uniref:Fibronectin type-III domain-containing protein n=1 Tax=Pricia mediterranea TaxID=3076079 RepID=A0ABU3LA47_9FLAO|nr:hypothetical protein [Pricia sp. S334]MDT7830433.1 hypothetical protein [Pricia sp. S334]
MDSVVEKTPVITPCKVQGIAPENGAPCADVKAVSEEPSKVSILFQWTSSEFADGYELHVFESQNEIFSKILTSLEATVTLDRGKSYSWSITAKNGNAEITSNTFSFTTPGEAMGNYVPYAAAITVAFDAMTSDMNIFWTGCDEDGDTLTYDIIIKENETLLAEFSDLSVESLDALPFVPSSVYSIEVTSKDNFGNFSISKHYEIVPN